ncbi:MULTISPECIES: prepilin peptidase [Vagococcus]|uniref:prepilin peptidase n=1 Tax=Vagococcus TaxID=2737 RepID=UPI000E51FACE|nr:MULTISPECIES: prepilin peptidase [Vagococcus]RHH71467.1 prepilin peptidase [Vagococcus sp. AM17-17]
MLNGYILLFFLGGSLASFFVLVGQRTRNGQSIVLPKSHCSICKHELSWYELVPVFSFLFLRGKCLFCFSTIPRQSMYLEVVSGLLFILLYCLLESLSLFIGLNVLWFISVIVINYKI